MTPDNIFKPLSNDSNNRGPVYDVSCGGSNPTPKGDYEDETDGTRVLGEGQGTDMPKAIKTGKHSMSILLTRIVAPF